MAGCTLFAGSGGRVVLPLGEGLLIDRADGGHLCVEPPRPVWERSELTADELTQWSFLISATGRAMIESLSQLRNGCVNYWEAGNWALNDAALPAGPKTAERYRRVHQHVIGRSPTAITPAWKWGEAPAFPRYADRGAWSAGFQPLTAAECVMVVRQLRRELETRYRVVVESPRPSLVVFDLAGTTVADDGQVPRAFLAALAEHGLKSDLREISRVRGASKRAAIRGFFPEGAEGDARSEGAYRSFKSALGEAYSAGGVREIAGARKLFADLRGAGVRVALNTGFDREITHLLIDALGWSREVADVIVCGDDVAEGRPAPDLIRRSMELTDIGDPAAVASVGDTALDLRAGASAGTAWNIGVLSGAHDLERLASEAHTDIAPDISYLRARWNLTD